MFKDLVCYRYNIMTRCWNHDANERPPFLQISKELKDIRKPKKTAKLAKKGSNKVEDYYAVPVSL